MKVSDTNRLINLNSVGRGLYLRPDDLSLVGLLYAVILNIDVHQYWNKNFNFGRKIYSKYFFTVSVFHQLV